MRQLNTNRMRRDLRKIVDDVERTVQNMAGAGGEQFDELKLSTGRRLRKVSSQLAELEHGAIDRARAAGKHTRDYVHNHPWVVVGSLAALVIALGVLTRRRR